MEEREKVGGEGEGRREGERLQIVSFHSIVV
jgi:hypothetical protein